MVGLNNFSNIFGIFLLTVSSRLSNALHGPLNVGIISKASPINLSQEHFPARFVNPWQPKGIFRMQNKEIVTSCTKVNQKGSMFHTTHLKNSGNDFNENEDLNSSRMAESDQALLGILGTFAGLVTLYSEFTLKSTGCGLPAGPYGLVGAVEGISYLTIVGIAGLAAYTKFETGNGLPDGPVGLLGLAQKLSFLCVSAGLLVLGFQIVEYGYIPNAVPMEGGMCQ